MKTEPTQALIDLFKRATALPKKKAVKTKGRKRR